MTLSLRALFTITTLASLVFAGGDGGESTPPPPPPPPAAPAPDPAPVPPPPVLVPDPAPAPEAGPTLSVCKASACPAAVPKDQLCTVVKQTMVAGEAASVCSVAVSYSNTIYYNPTETNAVSVLKVSLNSSSSIVIDAATPKAVAALTTGATQDCDSTGYSSFCKDRLTNGQCALIEQLGTILLLPCTPKGSKTTSMTFMVSAGYNPTKEGDFALVPLTQFQQTKDPAIRAKLANVVTTFDVSNHLETGKVNMAEPATGQSVYLQQLQAQAGNVTQGHGRTLLVSKDMNLDSWSRLQSETNPVQISQTFPFDFDGGLCLSADQKLPCSANSLGAHTHGSVTINAAISIKYATSFLAPLQASVIVTHSGVFTADNSFAMNVPMATGYAYEEVFKIFELIELMPEVSWIFQLLESSGITIGPVLNLATGASLSATANLGVNVQASRSWGPVTNTFVLVGDAITDITPADPTDKNLPAPAQNSLNVNYSPVFTLTGTASIYVQPRLDFVVSAFGYTYSMGAGPKAAFSLDSKVSALRKRSLPSTGNSAIFPRAAGQSCISIGASLALTSTVRLPPTSAAKGNCVLLNFDLGLTKTSYPLLCAPTQSTTDTQTISATLSKSLPAGGYSLEYRQYHASKLSNTMHYYGVVAANGYSIDNLLWNAHITTTGTKVGLSSYTMPPAAILAMLPPTPPAPTSASKLVLQDCIKYAITRFPGMTNDANPPKQVYILVPGTTGTASLVFGWQFQLKNATSWLQITATSTAILHVVNYVSNVADLSIEAVPLPLPGLDKTNNGLDVLTISPSQNQYGTSPYGWNSGPKNVVGEIKNAAGNNALSLDAKGVVIPGDATCTTAGVCLTSVVGPGQVVADRAASINAFYQANWFHDTLYGYGFTESAGNYQQTNFDQAGGKATDPVNVYNQFEVGELKIGRYTNGPNPTNLDCSLDNTVVLHESGHGVVLRLIAGSYQGGGVDSYVPFDNAAVPFEVKLLYEFFSSSIEARGLNEGWADAFGLFFTTNFAVPANSLGGVIGGYCLGNDNRTNSTTIGPASLLRSDMYSDLTNAPTNDPYRYGRVWGAILWALVDLKKYSPDWSTVKSPAAEHTGNVIALAIMVEGLKLGQATPTFIDARNQIIAAHQLIYGGAHKCLLWSVFSKRGLGVKAVGGKGSYGKGGVKVMKYLDDLTVPADC